MLTIRFKTRLDILKAINDGSIQQSLMEYFTKLELLNNGSISEDLIFQHIEIKLDNEIIKQEAIRKEANGIAKSLHDLIIAVFQRYQKENSTNIIVTKEEKEFLQQYRTLPAPLKEAINSILNLYVDEHN